MNRKIEAFTDGRMETLSIMKATKNEFMREYSRKMRVTLIFPDLIISPREYKTLGFFDPASNVIGISEEVLSDKFSEQAVKDIIGHECAHAINDQINESSSHDSFFKEVCSVIGVQNDKATYKEVFEGQEESNKVLNKIKKLLALSESTNVNESASALLKAQSLMAENNVSSTKDNDRIYRVNLITYTRRTVEITVLQDVLERITGAWVIPYKGLNESKLYAHGSRSEVEISDYLFDHISHELKRMLESYKKEHGSSKHLKRSFYLGVLNTFSERFKTKEEKDADTKALILHTGEVERTARRILYRGCRTTTSSHRTGAYNSSAYSAGKEAGNKVRINKGVKNQSSSSPLYLG